MFGSVAIGSTVSRSVTLTNNTATAYVVTPSISGAMFRITSRTGNQLLGPGRSTSFTVAFSPTQAGARTGTLTLSTTDTFMPTIPVPLSGTGL